MRRAVCRAPAALPSSSRRCSSAGLVQDLLEPQLVDLMDDDEQQLVVRVGRRALAGQQIVQAQVAAVGQVRGEPSSHASWSCMGDHHGR